MHLVIVFGPPASGKMTVGQELARLTGYRLFHNHMSIEPVLDVFDWGTPSFHRIVDGLRRQVIEEAAVAGLPGLIFTYVWPMDVAEDAAEVAQLVEPVRAAGGRVDFVELAVDLDTCLSREGTENRLRHKRYKADVDWAVEHNREMHAGHVFNTDGTFPLDYPHLVVDNNGSTAAETAQRVVSHLGLATVEG